MLIFPAKRIRAVEVARYVRAAGYPGVVCFSCGNASQALKDQGLDVVDVSPRGVLMPLRWWRPEEIRRCWPHLFDATSGHLPAHLMVTIGHAFRDHLGALPLAAYDVPTGSGETIVCLRWAYPGIKFTPVRDGGPATEYHPGAPLNDAVAWQDRGKL